MSNLERSPSCRLTYGTELEPLRATQAHGTATRPDVGALKRHGTSDPLGLPSLAAAATGRGAARSRILIEWRVAQSFDPAPRASGTRRSTRRPPSARAAATSARTRAGSTGFVVTPSTFTDVPTIAPSDAASRSMPSTDRPLPSRVGSRPAPRTAPTSPARAGAQVVVPDSTTPPTTATCSSPSPAARTDTASPSACCVGMCVPRRDAQVRLLSPAP